MPAFSTTTINDRTTAAVLMMESMQAYFSYGYELMCGLPSITLLGERADYEDILVRLDKFPNLGPETSKFADLLRPVLRRFLATFDPAQDAASLDFWGRIAHESSGGSGPSYLGGWLTAFCFWNNQGKCSHDSKRARIPFHSRNLVLELDGMAYDRVEIEEIPTGYASVPVLVEYNDKEYHIEMVAGSLGIRCTSSSDSDVEAGGKEDGEPDSIHSLSGWIMCEVDSNKAERDDKWMHYI
ncbi:hypothetical protein yc1106_07147 [Curvularia clavata]|uniref:Uncharacterized protein n=1 Tax=Curvularia clavata TaxID=95742 RepID=A0A9Q8ZFP2_CURCL|nr:hypothetical protein yc1106_07147 [Curvularia clavata]